MFSRNELYIGLSYRNKLNNLVSYTELKALPVKSCINALVTNNYNKDIFAGGTFSGKLFLMSLTLHWPFIYSLQGTCTYGNMKFVMTVVMWQSISVRHLNSAALLELRGWRVTAWIKTMTCWRVISMELSFYGK